MIFSINRDYSKGDIATYLNSAMLEDRVGNRDRTIADLVEAVKLTVNNLPVDQWRTHILISLVNVLEGVEEEDEEYN